MNLPGIPKRKGSQLRIHWVSISTSMISNDGREMPKGCLERDLERNVLAPFFD